MKRLICLVSLVVAASQVLAQGSMTQAQWKIHEARCKITEPPYGLAKVKRMIKDLAYDDESNKPMPKNEFDRLTFKEQFTYMLIHGEMNAQNCNPMPAVVGEDKKIFGFLPASFAEESVWSKDQRVFASKNRSRFIPLLQDMIRTNNRVGVNVKYVASEINAYELIPDIIASFKKARNDNDMLTLLMLFMKSGKYGPFLASASFKKLYMAEYSDYKNYLVGSRANQDLIMSRAAAFYSGWKKA